MAGKFAGAFVSTGGPGGGQEATVINSLSTLAHHGIVYVPLGYSRTFAQLSNVSEVHGGASLLFHPLCARYSWACLGFSGSPWGAGAFAGADGSRQPSALELEIAKIHGTQFYEIVARHTF